MVAVTVLQLAVVQRCRGTAGSVVLQQPAENISSAALACLKQDECLTPLHLSPTQNILPFIQLVLRLVVCVCSSLSPLVVVSLYGHGGGE